MSITITLLQESSIIITWGGIINYFQLQLQSINWPPALADTQEIMDLKLTMLTYIIHVLTQIVLETDTNF